MTPPVNPRTLGLYRRCLRLCRQMEPAAGNYYRRYAWEAITAYWEEDDPERVNFLLKKGEENRMWIARKYDLHDGSMDTPCPGNESASVGTERPGS